MEGRSVPWRKWTCRSSPGASSACRARWTNSGGSFDVAGREQRLGSLDQALAEPDIWNDAERATRLQRQRSKLQGEIESGRALAALRDDAVTLLELGREGEEVGDELGEAVERLAARTEEVELATLLTGDHDDADAIVEIHPGAGGTESQDWAQMLFRMYTRWAERHDFKVQTLDLQPGDEAGLKSATLSVGGINAYGYLRAERGVHRLVRISPFDAQSRRHTSFASVDVLPDLEEDIDVQIEEKDLRIDTYRSSGAGGQHVNVTDSAVRITHQPTGIVVTCQNERSQHRNKDVAMQILKAKLYTLAQQQAEEELAKEVGEKKKIEWGNQIRSYVLAPYRLVKDHRSGFEMGDADRVLDGDIDGFIRSGLALMRKRQESGEPA